MSAELHSYLILIVIGFLPSEIWRWLGIALGRGLDEQLEIILWVRGVATALIAGVIARIVLIPPGALAGVPLPVRLAALAGGFLGFLLIRARRLPACWSAKACWSRARSCLVRA
jgi:hypothetical protein